MAANLSRNLNDIKKITQYIAEAEHMGLSVTRPDINESLLKFSVTDEKIIRFGMGAIKGVGGAAVENIINERTENGPYLSPFDFVKRVNLRSVNKRSIEALIMAGAFDGFENTHRAQYFYRENENSSTFIETLIKHGSSYQEQKNSMQQSLFGGVDDVSVSDPEMPVCEPWPKPQMLKSEKDVIGFYISGHPLDDFKICIQRYCNADAGYLKANLKKYEGSAVSFAGMITKAQQRVSKKGNPFGIITIEDFSGPIDLMMFSEDYLKRKHFLEVGNNVLVQAKIEERYRGGELDIRVNNMMLLSEAMEKLTSAVVLNIPVGDLNDSLIDKLVELVRLNPGNSVLKIKFISPDKNNGFAMKSTTYKIEPQGFVNELAKIRGLSFIIES